MSFDPFANQGGPAAWDPEAAEQSSRAADEILASEHSEVHDDELIPNDGDPEQPGNLPDPDLETDAAEE